ncbi:hypothetical protein KBD75_00950 [Candidatus Woesebacteria bacterium]|nr:hypothetical protein [Candidatus Woesebacteria bacterium]
MTIAQKIRHYFTPHHTNNFRARILHNSGIFAVIGLLITGNLFLRLLDNPSLHILGFTSSISIDEVVRSTNETRASSGLKPLLYSEKLADAARRKASNMFGENYWSHNSPSGKSPWVWFKEAGYSYVFAGENLAKDFGDTNRMMNAWLASPTHKENIINPKYTEIGLAVVPGTLEGKETVLVVQLFGTPAGGAVSATSAVKNSSPIPKPSISPVEVSEVKGQEIAQLVPSDVEVLQITPTSSPVAIVPAKFNSFNVARALNLATTALFILALIVDLFLAESARLSRRVGNNWAHILFVNFILLAVTIVNAGKIM